MFDKQSLSSGFQSLEQAEGAPPEDSKVREQSGAQQDRRGVTENVADFCSSGTDPGSLIVL